MSNANQTRSDQQVSQEGGQPEVTGAEKNAAEDLEADREQLETGAEESAEKPLDLAAQLEEANANYLRAKAEVENILKRTRREIEEHGRYAALPVMRDLLAVVDNLHRAIEAAQKDENASGLLEGVKMVEVQLGGVLDQHGCKPINALGEPFDPNLHEAIGQEASDEIPANHVSRELQTGYQLHGRVVRPSQVFVSTGPAEETPEQP